MRRSARCSSAAPRIFGAMRELVASARHDVAIQTYVWQDSQVSQEMLDGLAELNRRLQRNPPSEPVDVRILVDQLGPGLGAPPAVVLKERIDALRLDPSRIHVTIASFDHTLLGNLHAKTIVVDGRSAIITGANVQPINDPGHPQNDFAFRIDGDAALALLADHDDAWKEAGHAPRAPTPRRRRTCAAHAHR